MHHHIDFAKVRPGTGAALHIHEWEERFVALTGRWKIYWGDGGDETVILQPVDWMLVPDSALRGFGNVSKTEAVLMTVLGAHDTGHCVWAESLRTVFAGRTR